MPEQGLNAAAGPFLTLPRRQAILGLLEPALQALDQNLLFRLTILPGLVSPGDGGGGFTQFSPHPRQQGIGGGELGRFLLHAPLLIQGSDQGRQIAQILVLKPILAIQGEAHPAQDAGEPQAHDDQSRTPARDDKPQDHDPQQADDEGGEGPLHHAPGGDGVHADVVVDSVHFVDAIQGLVLMDLRLLDLLAAVEDAVHVEMDPHPIGEGLGGVIGRGEGDPPDGRVVDGRQQADGDQRQEAGHQASGGICLRVHLRYRQLLMKAGSATGRGRRVEGGRSTRRLAGSRPA